MTWNRLWRHINYEDAYALAGIIVLIGGIFCTFFSLMIYGSSLTDANDKAEARERVVTVLAREESPAERVELANTMLDLYMQGFQSDVTSDEVDELQAVARDGNTPKLNTSRMNWDVYFFVVLPILLGAAWLVHGLGAFYAYAIHTIDDTKTFFADLPWRRVWPFFFALITIVPGIVVYPVSAVRLYRQRRWDQQNPTPEEVTVPTVTVLDTLPGFSHSPEEAAACYKELRNSGHRKRIENQLELAKNEEQIIVSELTSLGESIRSRQTQRRELLARIRELENTNLDEEIVDDTTLEKEFANLAKMRGVAGIKVVGNRIVLLVKVRYPYEGAIYDLGDWQISFGEDHFATRELRSGVLPTWRGTSPVYRLGFDTFCFGNKDYEIMEHIRKDQYLEAVDLAVACMHTINDNDIAKVPLAFTEVG